MIRFVTIFSLILTAWGIVKATSYDTRIVGGADVTIADYPYQVLIEVDRNFCGGSLLSERYVLTACHCVFHYHYRPDLIFVRVNTSFVHIGGTIYNTTEVYVHPEFDPDILSYDSAILKLCLSVTFGSGVGSISLPDPSAARLAEGTDVTFTGWGYLNKTSGASLQLQAVTITVISHVDCINQYQSVGLIVTDSMFCAKSRDDQNKGVCIGDSGGPLVANGVQYGIVSWTEDRCADFGYPSVFADVTSFRDFLNNVTGI